MTGRLSVSTVARCVSAIPGFILLASFFCSSVYAESLAPEALRKLVWSAAQEIESGNIESARDMLDRAAAVDDPPADVSALIGRLQTSLVEIDAAPEADQPVADQELAKDIAVDTEGMSQQELQNYLESVSDAIDSLFERG